MWGTGWMITAGLGENLSHCRFVSLSTLTGFYNRHTVFTARYDLNFYMWRNANFCLGSAKLICRLDQIGALTAAETMAQGMETDWNTIVLSVANVPLYAVTGYCRFKLYKTCNSNYKYSNSTNAKETTERPAISTPVGILGRALCCSTCWDASCWCCCCCLLLVQPATFKLKKN